MEKGKILIFEHENKLISALVRDNKAALIQAHSHKDTNSAASIGDIYVGRVNNIAVNIGAAFVEINNGEMTFLPLEEAGYAIVTNRKPDGTVKPGDELLVQIVKEPVKNKLAGVSAQLSLAGSYTVIKYRQKGAPHSGKCDAEKESLSGSIEISSKLGKKYHHLYKDSEPLEKIAEHFDIIIRTNAAYANDVSTVTDEAESLAGEMERILHVGDKRTCYSCMHKSEPEYLRFVRDCYNSDYDEIVTDIRSVYDALMGDKGLKEQKIRYYEDNMISLKKLYSMETRIKELLDKKVWLQSGAYIVIEHTEALTAIDVNTGKYESKKNMEETYFKINMEAADEIAASLRSRNISGMILVDFINMAKREHEKLLTEHMKELLRQDSISARVVDITGLGLMEITRKKKNKSFAEQMRI